MPDGATLTIATTNVELGPSDANLRLAVTPGAYVALTVRDTGVGMTAEVQAHLFETFFTTKAVGKGTGLGLATVHGIVTRSGGNVRVQSDTGRGTSFTVYFPSADAAGMVADVPQTLILHMTHHLTNGWVPQPARSRLGRRSRTKTASSTPTHIRKCDAPAHQHVPQLSAQ
jgi:hypothetical protein